MVDDAWKDEAPETEKADVMASSSSITKEDDQKTKKKTVTKKPASKKPAAKGMASEYKLMWYHSRGAVAIRKAGGHQVLQLQGEPPPLKSMYWTSPKNNCQTPSVRSF